ncbi:cyanase [Intrasporangium sp.]|uniref:cyanase n=1 Tax=Intrasporangium sp. TaxID=1925024 RepID=UPI003221CE46
MSMNAAKERAAEQVRTAKNRAGLTWRALAEHIDRPVEWTTAALLGQHPVAERDAERLGALLDLDDEAVAALQAQPYRTGLGDAANDPTIYRFLEAVAVYGPTIKELIHEEFGDGIMSAINFKIDVSRRADPGGDRVVVTFDGKFLDYSW